MSAHARKLRPWRGLLIPAVLLFAFLVGLGTWQIQRKTWKEGLIAVLNERLGAPPSALPPPGMWPSLGQAHDEYRRVKFSAAFDQGREALVYAAASAFRPDVSGPGYWVFTPAHLADGGFVMVNRGFVPEAKREAATRPAGEIGGPVEIVGVMRWPERRGWFSPADSPNSNLWFTRDPLAIAAAKGLPAVAPFYVEQESPVPPGGLPQSGKIVPKLRNEHLQYALTWFGLAIVLVIAFGVWAFNSGGEERRGKAPKRP